MKIKKLEIENYRSIKGASLDLMENLNVFVGVNGSGKTTILDAASVLLSWLVNRIQRQNSNGNSIAETDIRNDMTFSSLEITAVEKDNTFNWKLRKTAKGTNSTDKSELNGVTELAAVYQESLLKENKLPIIVYYPVNRVVDKTSPDIKGKEDLHILDVYDNALGGKRNYQSFFEWFRLQDDIVNEEAMSRSKWMRQNQKMIRSRVKRLFDLLKEGLSDPKESSEFEDLNYLIKRFGEDDMIYEEPRYLFHELSHLIEVTGIHSSEHFRYEKIFHELEYMFHKMEMLSRENKDDLIDYQDGRYTETVENIVRDFQYGFQEKELDEKIIRFVWETFILANTLSLWWMSEKGRREMEKELQKQIPDIRQIDSDWSQKLISSLHRIANDEIKQKKRAYKSEGHELRAVAKAIEHFVPEYKSLRVKRVPRPHMLIDKEGEAFNMDQLSDGEKNLITLVGDIARRLAIANPESKEPLKGNGIILIDEIDLHLHPAWQRLMLPQLTTVFPNCQFLITTHSPIVLSQVKPDNIFLLTNKGNELSFEKATESYGMNADRILEDLLGVDSRPRKEKDKLHKLFKFIQDGELEKAKAAIEDFEYKGEPELVKARGLIKRKEIIGR